MLEIDFPFLFLQQPSPLLDYSLHVWMLMRMRGLRWKFFLWGILAYITKIFFFPGLHRQTVLIFYFFYNEYGVVHWMACRFDSIYRFLSKIGQPKILLSCKFLNIFFLSSRDGFTNFVNCWDCNRYFYNFHTTFECGFGNAFWHLQWNPIEIMEKYIFWHCSFTSPL